MRWPKIIIYLLRILITIGIVLFGMTVLMEVFEVH
mgnify:CR=1 FL=1|jgi:hypothetical protein